MGRGRRSPHDIHKGEIAEKIKQGIPFSQIKAEYPQIPPYTLQRWCTDFHRRFIEPKPEVAPEKPELVVIKKNFQISDIDWVKQSCKQIFNEEYDNQIKLRALDVFLKAVAMNKTDESSEDEDSEDLKEKYRDMSASDLSRVYREKLG